MRPAVPRTAPRAAPAARRHGVARVLSKAGLTSRTQAAVWVRAGRVRVNDRTVLDPEHAVRDGVDRVEVDGRPLRQAGRTVLMLNKPRGLVCTTRDERGRDTVYACFAGADLPWLAPVGRLDKASEGLLLFTNDPQWAAHITDPASGPHKTYHVQIDRLPDAALCARLCAGVSIDGERLAARAARELRRGAKHAWLEIVLDEGRNRQIRRLLEACDVGVLRLIRVSIGSLALGTLTSGRWRALDAAEIGALLPADD